MSIFPPSGPQDKDRARLIESDETRRRLLFSLELCDTILERRPRHVEALEMAAEYFTRLGYYVDGLALDRRLAALFPYDPVVVYNLSCSLALVGEKEAALEQLSRAVDNGYRNHESLMTDHDLDSIRLDPRFAGIFQRLALADDTEEC
jgi:hypothetical protein